jgi:PAS domain S-box-containing protein
MARALRTGESTTAGEVVIEQPDGRRVTVMVNIRALRDPAGRICGAINCFQDITDQKRTEQRLRASEQDATRLLDALPAAIYTTDADGKITFYNRAAAEMAGREPTIGSDEWCVTWKLFTPEGEPLPHSECPMARSLRERRPIRNVEAVAERPNGVRVPFAPFPTPMFDDSGELTGGVNMLVDISERKRFEAQIRAQTDRAETLNDIATILAGDLDLERIVQTVTDSATRLSGAKFGAFFYNVIGDEGESYLLFALSGAPRSAFERFGYPRNTDVFRPTFAGEGVVRSDDIRKDPRYGRNAPHHGMPEGHLRVVSYLAAPVISRSGEVIGGLFFGHDEAGVFQADTEELVKGIAAHAALAIDNARLFSEAQREIEHRRHAERAAARRLAEQTALYEFTDRLYRADSLTSINEAALDAIQQALQCDRAAILSFDDGGLMRFSAWRDLSDAYREGVEGHSPWTRGARQAKPIAIDDISASNVQDDLKAIVRREGIASLAFVPIFSAGQLSGKFMAYYNQPHAFSHDELELALTIARQLGFSLERRRAEEERTLLVNELNHRVKNTLSTVQSLAMQTMRGLEGSGPAYTAFSGRLAALSRAHDLLTERRWIGADLEQVVRQSISPFDGPGRFSVEGQAVSLTPKQAVAISMALHELSTNAAKYGALSSVKGGVDIAWTIADGKLELAWTERNGPPVKPPSHSGFGLRLIGRALAHDLGATADLKFAPDGVAAVLRSPIETGTASAQSDAREHA